MKKDDGSDVKIVLLRETEWVRTDGIEPGGSVYLNMPAQGGWGHSPNPKAIRNIVICASEELATRVLRSGLTGVVFSKPEHWRDFPPPAWRPLDAEETWDEGQLRRMLGR